MGTEWCTDTHTHNSQVTTSVALCKSDSCGIQAPMIVISLHYAYSGLSPRPPRTYAMLIFDGKRVFIYTPEHRLCAPCNGGKAQPDPLGCFGDDQDDRVMEAQYSSSSMTPTVSETLLLMRGLYRRAFRTHGLRATIAISFRLDRHSTAPTTCAAAKRCWTDAQILMQTLAARLKLNTYLFSCISGARCVAVVLFCCVSPIYVQVCANYCRNESPRYVYYATQWGEEVREV